MTVYAWLVQPFVEYGFMRRALVASLAIGVSSGPIGTLLVLRRMSLVGDAMAHALLPGAAIGFIVAGLSLWAMSLGALIAGLVVALIAAAVTRMTSQREDASFAAFYLIALASGVMLVSLRGNTVDLMHLLFGTVLAIDESALVLVAAISSTTLIVLAVVYRAMVVECFDPDFLRSVGGPGARVHLLFLTLVVMNLVGSFQAMGTLMSVGLLMLPAITARFWTRSIVGAATLAAMLAALSGWCGLLLSYHASLPSGPSIVLVAGAAYTVSLLFGRRDSLRARHRWVADDRIFNQDAP